MTLLASEIDQLLKQAAGLASEYLERNADRAEPVIRYRPPAELRKRHDFAPPAAGRPLEELLGQARAILEDSVRTGHPRFFNQLFGGFDAAAILGEWITALLNTSMYTYEVAPVATLMEQALVERMCRCAGFERGEGVFAPGGSISNLMALLVARERALPGCKDAGIPAGVKPVLFVSEEAHYSLRRTAAVAGLGLQAVVDVPADEQGRMLPGELEQAVRAARARGALPFFVGATAGTTVPGAFDPLEPIGAIAAEHGLWFHVDGSYGGSVLLSRRHRGLMQGVERADSLCWNPHKMMGVPLACAALLVREKGLLPRTFGMRADYLFHEGAEEGFDLGDYTLQCGRRVDAVKLWLSWQAHGDAGFEQRIDRLFELAAQFAAAVAVREAFALVRAPAGPNVCFQYLPPAARGMAAGAERSARLHAANTALRRRLVEDGAFLVNYATLDGAATFRLVLSNPDTTAADLEALLDRMQALGADL